MEILQLISDYISCSRNLCTDLRQFYGIPDELTLLTARKSYDLIPKNGRLPNGVNFNFHGGGCYFEFENGAIDVDFGPNDRCDGFDFYRIKQFLLMTKKSIYPALKDERILEEQFSYCVQSGIIYNPKLSPGTELYYLK